MQEMKAVSQQLEAGGTTGAPTGVLWALGVLSKVFGNEGSQKLTDAVGKARAAGVPWLTILTTVISLVATLLSGGKLDLAAIIQAILNLIVPTPTPMQACECAEAFLE